MIAATQAGAVCPWRLCLPYRQVDQNSHEHDSEHRDCKPHLVGLCEGHPTSHSHHLGRRSADEVARLFHVDLDKYDPGAPC